MEEPKSTKQYQLEPDNLKIGNIDNTNPDYSRAKGESRNPAIPPIKSLLKKFRLSQEATAIDRSNVVEKFDYYLPFTLRWYLRQFYTNTHRDDFTFFFPTYYDQENRYRKEVHEYKVGVSKLSIVDKESDHGFRSIDAPLCQRYIINHLSHEVVRDEVLQSRYYWTTTRARSQRKYPAHILLDIDSAIVADHKEQDEVHSHKNLPRTSRKLNRLINEIVEVMHPATPMLFYSSSQSLDKRHLYFFLDDDVCNHFKLKDLKQLTANVLSPVLSKYGIAGFKNGEIEFRPSDVQNIILPFGLNSRYMRRDGQGRFRIYQKEYKKKDEQGKWRKKYHNYSTYDAMEYLAKQDCEGKVHRISFKEIQSWRDAKVVSVPEDALQTKRKEQKRNEKRGLSIINQKYDISQIQMDDSYQTIEFLKNTILPKLLWSYFPGEVDVDDAKRRLGLWFNYNLSSNSKRGINKWIDTSDKHNSYLGLFECYLKKFSPNKYYRLGITSIKGENRTEELYRKLFEYTSVAPFRDLPKKRGGMHRLYAFQFICRVMTCIHPDYNHSRTIEMTEEDGLYTYKVNIGKKFVDGWGIRALQRDGLNKFIYGFRKIDVMNVPPFWGAGRYARKWEITLPFNYYDYTEKYQLEWDGMDAMEKYISDEQVLKLCSMKKSSVLKELRDKKT